MACGNMRTFLLRRRSEGLLRMRTTVVGHVRDGSAAATCYFFLSCLRLNFVWFRWNSFVEHVEILTRLHYIRYSGLLEVEGFSLIINDMCWNFCVEVIRIIWIVDLFQLAFKGWTVQYSKFRITRITRFRKYCYGYMLGGFFQEFIVLTCR